MRPVPLLLGGAAVLVSLVVAIVFYRAFGDGADGVQYGVRSYVVSSTTSVRVSFEVAKDPARTALCTVRARDRDGVETGSALVRVGPSPQRSQVVTYDLLTRDRAASGEVTGCSLQPAGSS